MIVSRQPNMPPSFGAYVAIPTCFISVILTLATVTLVWNQIAWSLWTRAATASYQYQPSDPSRPCTRESQSRPSAPPGHQSLPTTAKSARWARSTDSIRRQSWSRRHGRRIAPRRRRSSSDSSLLVQFLHLDRSRRERSLRDSFRICQRRCMTVSCGSWRIFISAMRLGSAYLAISLISRASA